MNTTFEKYLDTIDKCLKPLPTSERVDIVKEIKGSILEMESENLSTEQILTRLGKPKDLAKAYLGDLLAKENNFSWNRFLTVCAFYSLVGFSGLFVIPVLVIVAPTFILCGVASAVLGIIKLVDYLLHLNIPYVDYIGFQFGNTALSPIPVFILSLITGIADLGTVMGNVYHTKEEMIDCVNAFYEGMVQRSEEMKRHPNYKTGENYAYLGLPPCFLIFDEYVAFFEMLGTKESVGLLSQLKKIVMLGRQAGYFLIVACQRPDAKYFSDGIRDNFNFRVGLGRISELGYGMLFGSDVKKQFFQKRIKGRGYCDVGTSVISEFYTPLVPKGHDFLQIIGSLAQARQDGTATCEAKGDGTD